MHQQQTAFENIAGKEEIDCNEQFLLFPQCFLLNQKIVSQFVLIFDIISLFAAELEEPRMGLSGKGLKDTTKHLKLTLTVKFPIPIFICTVGSTVTNTITHRGGLQTLSCTTCILVLGAC